MNQVIENISSHHLLLKKVSIAISILLLIMSCTLVSEEKPKFVADHLVAHFDYFSYSGNDDFYIHHALPDSDYYYNPILPGWYSDPSVGSDGKNFFMVNSTFSYFPGVPIFHSTDLMNWKQIGHVLDRHEQLPLEGQRTSEGIFAPAISYNPHNKTWYMITTNIKKGNFFVKTKDPFGAWSNPIWLPDVHGIDPSFFFDDDGKAYIVNNDVPDGGSLYQGHRAIRITQFDADKDVTLGTSLMLVNGGVNIAEKPIWIEGPHMYKIHGKYFLMCAEGGTSVDHREVIFKSDSPWGNFMPKKEPILTQRHLDKDREYPITCAGHADLIQKVNGEWWAVFLACRPLFNRFENLGRESFLMPVRWGKDGFPFITKENELIPRIVQMENIPRDSVVTFGNVNKVDEFDDLHLGMEWMSLRGDISHLYSLVENPGFLTLKCANVSSKELQKPAFIARRLQHHKFECATQMYFTPKSESECAGLLLYKDETHQYLCAVTLKNNTPVIQLIKVKEDGVDILAERKLLNMNDAIDLKIVSDGLGFSFLYKLSSSSQWITMASEIDAYYLSTAQSYGFTGTTVGLYASKKGY